MTRTFKGRAVIPGAVEAPALVSRQGFNILASLQRDMIARKKAITSGDQNNPSIYGKTITGRALCMPRSIGSTTGGMALQKAAASGLAPRAILCAERIDSLAAAGVILAKVWNDATIVTVDGLGEEFLDAVADGDTVRVGPDGSTTVEHEEEG